MNAATKIFFIAVIFALGIAIGAICMYSRGTHDASTSVSFEELAENPSKYDKTSVTLIANMLADDSGITFFPTHPVKYTFDELSPPWVKSRDHRWSFRSDPNNVYRTVSVKGVYIANSNRPPTLGYFETVEKIEMQKVVIGVLPAASRIDGEAPEVDPFGSGSVTRQ